MNMNVVVTRLLIAACFALSALPGLALNITSPSTEWTVVSYGNENYPDYFSDQQTGQADSDIVGTNGAPAFYTKFDDANTPSLTDGTLGFRVRVSDASKSYWENVLFIGMDANLDGAMDLFAGLYKNNTVNLYYPGTGLNISPNTTTIQSAFYSLMATDGDNYSFSIVDSVNAPGQPSDIDGVPSQSPADYYVSFSIDFAQIVAGLETVNISVNENSAMTFLAATATQQNSLNQDLNGAPKISQANGDWTWQELGAASTPITPTGETVPEPATAGMVTLSAALIWLYRRSRSQALQDEKPGLL